MNNITTQFDPYIKDLVRKLEMLWTVELNNGLIVYSDYNRYFLSPWHRLINYCRNENLYPVKVKAVMFGAPSITMFEDKNGLDGLFIMRGSAKDIEIDSGEGNSIAYKKLIVGLLDKNTDKVKVKKFCWPENEIEPMEETRKLTESNLELMFFKDEQEKNRKMSILISNNGRLLQS